MKLTAVKESKVYEVDADELIPLISQGKLDRVAYELLSFVLQHKINEGPGSYSTGTYFKQHEYLEKALAVLFDVKPSQVRILSQRNNAELTFGWTVEIKKEE